MFNKNKINIFYIQKDVFIEKFSIEPNPLNFKDTDTHHFGITKNTIFPNKFKIGFYSVMEFITVKASYVEELNDSIYIGNII